jgi:putative flippase GtrA
VDKYSKLIKQVAFFGIVGAVTLLIDIGVSAACFYIFQLPAYLASGIGFLSGFFFNFPMNRKKVFHHTEHDRFTFQVQVLFYVILCIFNLITTSLLVEVMVNSNILEIQYAKIAVTILIAFWNFLLFKFFIFSKNIDTNNPVSSN